MKKILVIGILVTVLLFTLTACLAIGASKVKILPPDKVIKIEEVYGQHTKDVLPGWMLGVVYEVYWTPGYGFNADEHNKVRLRVYVPQGTIILVPVNPRHEKYFAENYNPGDIIMFRARDIYQEGGRYADGVYPKNFFYVGVEDVLMAEKGGLLK